jgi:hypothetical protein
MIFTALRIDWKTRRAAISLAAQVLFWESRKEAAEEA